MFEVHRWTKTTSRKPRCLSAGSYSLYLQLKPTIWAQSYPRKCTNCPTPLQERHFSAPLRHAEKQQLYWNCEKLPLQSSSLQPPKLVNWPTKWLGYSLWQLLKISHRTSKIAWDVPKNDFSLILAPAISGKPAPEICFLSVEFRLAVLPIESLNICELDTQLSNWEADTPSLGYRRPGEIFVANA